MSKKRKETFADICVKLQKEDTHNPSLSGLKTNPSTDYPLFGFRYLRNDCHKPCKKPEFYFKFLERLQKLSELGWREIEKSDRHSFGTENINLDVFKPKFEMPDIFKSQDHLTVFRATGDKHVFAGVREGHTFHIFFIESDFGNLYDHD